MKKILVVSSILVGLIMSCGKDEESKGYLEPIAVLTPSSNPATTIKGAFINYKAVLTNDEYIDSAQVYIQSDSVGTGYDPSKDSLVYKIVYPVGAKKNIQTIEGKTLPSYFPPTGKSVYLTFMFRSQTKYPSKTIKLEVL